MRISTTLSLYVGRQYLLAFAAVLTLFLVIILLADVVELLRRVAGKPYISFGMVLEMALLKLPYMGQRTFPFGGLFAGIIVFWRLSRNQELTVVRASGVSAWQFLLPVLVVAAGLGIFQTTVVNPLASTFLSRYEREEAYLVDRTRNTLAISESGLWLRQVGETGQSVVHASHVLQQDREIELRNVSVFNYEGSDTFVGRIEAAFAELVPGAWLMRDVWLMTPEKPSRFETELRLPTDLTLARIQDSFASPETISFWELPGFITVLEKSGFSALGHRLHFNSLLAAPLLMGAMVLIAASFSLRHPRKGGTLYVVAGGVLTGFVLHIFSDVVFAIGLSDRVPVALAAWTPAVVATLLGLTSLLHLEDG
ncbi:MAG: LPS export ABC transporter permease LptG [Rhodospirillales bacterium]|nr:LPS export ABC transporter permease LptG [Rhodospirillales bacterium]